LTLQFGGQATTNQLNATKFLKAWQKLEDHPLAVSLDLSCIKSSMIKEQSVLSISHRAIQATAMQKVLSVSLKKYAVKISIIQPALPILLLVRFIM
jgi:hypothetical protein